MTVHCKVSHCREHELWCASPGIMGQKCITWADNIGKSVNVMTVNYDVAYLRWQYIVKYKCKTLILIWGQLKILLFDCSRNVGHGLPILRQKHLNTSLLLVSSQQSRHPWTFLHSHDIGAGVHAHTHNVSLWETNLEVVHLDIDGYTTTHERWSFN